MTNIEDLKKRMENKSLPESAKAKLKEMIEKLEKETTKTKTYKLGDQWSADFDYDGMLKMGLEANIDWGVEKLRKLHSSFEDVNYHQAGKPLWAATEYLKEGDKEQAKKAIEKFHEACKEELKEEDPEEPNEITGAIMMLEELLPDLKGKDKKECMEAIEMLKEMQGGEVMEKGGDVEIKKEGTLNDGDHIQYELDIHEINPTFNHKLYGTIEKDFENEYYATYMNEMYDEHLYEKTFKSFESAEKWVLGKINAERERYIKEFGIKMAQGGTLHVSDIKKDMTVYPMYGSYAGKEAKVVRIMPDGKTVEVVFKHKMGNEYSKYKGDELTVKMAKGGNIKHNFNPKSFTLEELDNNLISQDIFISYLRVGDSNTNASKRDILWASNRTSTEWNKIKDWKLTISDYGQLQLDKGSENIYLMLIVYKENDSQPMELQIYTKENHKGLKDFASQIVEKFKQGGNIGFIPMDLEEDLRYIAKFGGTTIDGVVGILSAMTDAGVTDVDLAEKGSKEKKIKEIWSVTEPKYKGELKGNMYYSVISRLIDRSGDGILKRFKPFRKGQMGKGNTVFTKDGVEVEKGTQKYKGRIFYDENGDEYECLGYNPKWDECMWKNVKTGDLTSGCLDGFYYNKPKK